MMQSISCSGLRDEVTSSQTLPLCIDCKQILCLGLQSSPCSIYLTLPPIPASHYTLLSDLLAHHYARPKSTPYYNLSVLSTFNPQEDRKQANVYLSAENQRLKKQVFDLTLRLADVEAGKTTKRGEAATLASMRYAVCSSNEIRLCIAEAMQICCRLKCAKSTRALRRLGISWFAATSQKSPNPREHWEHCFICGTRSARYA